MRRILIADDSPAVRKALIRLLEETYAVFEVVDGQAALARALELQPDLVILDLAMPAMDGLTAAREISKVLPQIPILMYTMHWAAPLELEAQKSGVRKVISKGHTQELFAAIEELLQTSPQPSHTSESAPAPELQSKATSQDSAIIAAAHDQPKPEPLTQPKPNKLAS